MVDMLLRAVMASNPEGFIWDRAGPLLMRLSETASPPSLDWVITLLSPHAPWHSERCDESMVVRWAKAASTMSYTEEVGCSVVDTLPHIASVDSLRSHIPIEIWAWLKRQPSLPLNVRDDRGAAAETSFVESDHSEISGFSSHTCFLFGRNGISSTARSSGV